MKAPWISAFLFALTLLCSARRCAADDEELLRSIVDGYRANRDSFRFMTCRSVITHGQAESIDKALAGEYVPGDRIVGQGFYAKQGKTERTDLIYPPELQEKFRIQSSDHTFTTTYVSERQLGNGALIAKHYPDYSQASIGEGDRNWLSYNLVRPFDLGINGKDEMMALDRVIETALAGRGATYEGEKSLGGVETWGVTCIAYGLKIRLWIDPQRGFLPVKEELYLEDELLYSFRLLDVQACSQQRWLPIRGIRASRPGKLRTSAFREVRITEYEVDRPSPPETLRLDLPPGTSVTDTRTMTPWSSGKDGAPRALNLSDPPVRSNSQTAIAARAGRSSLGEFEYAPSGPMQGSSHVGRWLAAALVVLIALVVAFVVYRKRQTA